MDDDVLMMQTADDALSPRQVRRKAHLRRHKAKRAEIAAIDLRIARSEERQPSFISFGKRSDTFVSFSFGKHSDTFVPFGKRSDTGKRSGTSCCLRDNPAI